MRGPYRPPLAAPSGHAAAAPADAGEGRYRTKLADDDDGDDVEAHRFSRRH
jgi:hypothetical protein